LRQYVTDEKVEAEVAGQLEKWQTTFRETLRSFVTEYRQAGFPQFFRLEFVVGWTAVKDMVALVGSIKGIEGLKSATDCYQVARYRTDSEFYQYVDSINAKTYRLRVEGGAKVVDFHSEVDLSVECWAARWPFLGNGAMKSYPLFYDDTGLSGTLGKKLAAATPPERLQEFIAWATGWIAMKDRPEFSNLHALARFEKEPGQRLGQAMLGLTTYGAACQALAGMDATTKAAVAKAYKGCTADGQRILARAMEEANERIVEADLPSFWREKSHTAYFSKQRLAPGESSAEVDKSHEDYLDDRKDPLLQDEPYTNLYMSETSSAADLYTLYVQEDGFEGDFKKVLNNVVLPILGLGGWGHLFHTMDRDALADFLKNGLGAFSPLGCYLRAAQPGAFATSADLYDSIVRTQVMCILRTDTGGEKPDVKATNLWEITEDRQKREKWNAHYMMKLEQYLLASLALVVESVQQGHK